jgi:arylsulfatase A-like enzyme
VSSTTKRLPAAALVAALALLAGWLVQTRHLEESDNKRRPNIVLIVVDTVRADHLPFYGYERNTAPFLSKLAEKGVVFENAFATSSWTLPSTASIFTSLYPREHGVDVWDTKRNSINTMSERIDLLTEVLKAEGYTSSRRRRRG